MLWTASCHVSALNRSDQGLTHYNKTRFMILPIHGRMPHNFTNVSHSLRGSRVVRVVENKMTLIMSKSMCCGFDIVLLAVCWNAVSCSLLEKSWHEHQFMTDEYFIYPCCLYAMTKAKEAPFWIFLCRLLCSGGLHWRRPASLGKLPFHSLENMSYQ